MKGRSTAWLLAAAGIGSYVALRAVRRRLRFYDLQGKVILLTGGSRGLGLVLARELATYNPRLILCARDPDELYRARDELSQRRIDVLAVPCDVADKAQVDGMIEHARKRFGPIDVLINNAGVIQVGPVETMNLQDFEEAMRTHFWGPLHTTLAVLPEMCRRRQGRIVNITSIGGKIAVPHLVPYDASKFALVGLSEGLRAELVKDNVYVTTVCPGLMRTGSPRNAEFKGQHRAEYAWFSLSDAMPGFSMSAESAARRIVKACQNGEAEVILSLPAKVAAAFHGVFPGLTCDVLSLVNRMLPGPGGDGKKSVKGKDSQSAVSPSWLTILNERAALRNNELP